MAFPDKPTSPKQRYFLTDNGKALIANVTSNPGTSNSVEKLNHMIGSLSEEEKRMALELLQKESEKKRILLIYDFPPHTHGIRL